jgi:hypothetical protein
MRIELEDGSGRWFNPESCEPFVEAEDWDPATGVLVGRVSREPEFRQVLHRTRDGVHILFSAAGYHTMTVREAHEWLGRNGHQAAIPETKDGTFASELAEPWTNFTTRLPPSLQRRLKGLAGIRGLTIQNAVAEAVIDWCAKLS